MNLRSCTDCSQEPGIPSIEVTPSSPRPVFPVKQIASALTSQDSFELLRKSIKEKTQKSLEEEGVLNTIDELVEDATFNETHTKEISDSFKKSDSAVQLKQQVEPTV